MAQGNLRGVFGGASGILSGAAALATVVAAIVGILSQFGLTTSHDAPKTVAATPVPRPPMVTKASGAPVVARVAAPHLPERRRAKPPPAEVALAEPTASNLGEENRNFSHVETPGAANTTASIDHNQPKASLARGKTKEWGPAT